MKYSFTKLNRTLVFDRFQGLRWELIASVLDGWKEGQKGWIEIKKQGKPKSPEELGYYYAVILPTAFEAFKENGEFDIVITCRDKTVKLPLSKDAVDIFLKSRYGEWHGEYKGKGDMSLGECAAFMSWAIAWLAQHLNCHVPPADQDWRDKI